MPSVKETLARAHYGEDVRWLLNGTGISVTEEQLDILHSRNLDAGGASVVARLVASGMEFERAFDTAVADNIGNRRG
jgi:hypothetical protein